MPSTTQDRRPLHLLRLPRKLRTRIYEFVLTERNDIPILDETWRPPGFLSVCRQIRHEASKIYYCDNGFEIVRRLALRWLMPRPTLLRLGVSTVVVLVDCEPADPLYETAWLTENGRDAHTVLRERGFGELVSIAIYEPDDVVNLYENQGTIGSRSNRCVLR